MYLRCRRKKKKKRALTLKKKAYEVLATRMKPNTLNIRHTKKGYKTKQNKAYTKTQPPLLSQLH